MKKIIFLLFFLLFAVAVAAAGAVAGEPAKAATDNAPLPMAELADFAIPQGKVLYNRYCLFCHGEKGEGDGLNAYTLPRKPADLSRIVEARSPQQLIRSITGEDSASAARRIMPSFGATLNKKYLHWLVDYLRLDLAKEK